MNDNIGYHFTGDTLRDGSPIPAIGETLVFGGEIVMCCCGYHFSRRPHQALRYAPGNMLHKVRFSGTVIEDDDKGVATERTILASIDAEHLLRRFAADQALSVAHLWEMPAVVRDYLTDLDPAKQTTARKAAFAAVVAVGAQGAAFTAVAAATAAAWDAAGAARKAAVEAVAAGDAAWSEFDRRVMEAFK